MAYRARDWNASLFACMLSHRKADNYVVIEEEEARGIFSKRKNFVFGFGLLHAYFLFEQDRTMCPCWDHVRRVTGWFNW